MGLSSLAVQGQKLGHGKESQRAGAGTGFPECYVLPGKETEQRTAQNSSPGLQQQGQHLTPQNERSAGWLCGTRAKQIAVKKLRQVAGKKLRQERRKEPCVQNRSSKCKSKTRKYFTSFINPLETAGQRAVLIVVLGKFADLSFWHHSTSGSHADELTAPVSHPGCCCSNLENKALGVLAASQLCNDPPHPRPDTYTFGSLLLYKEKRPVP